jgi:hypothetical protein
MQAICSAQGDIFVSPPRLRRRRIVAVLQLCILLMAITFLPLRLQAAPGSQAPRTQAPLHLLYRHFLAYQMHLDQIADEDFRQGKDGSDFRDHYQRALGFTGAEFAPIRTAARRLDGELKIEDERIKAVIDSYRAQTPRIVSGPGELPAAPAELGQLQQERDAIIKKEIRRLNAALGPVRAAKLQQYIQNEVAQHARQVQPAHPLSLHDPAKNPLSPFPNGGVQ